MKTVSWFSAGVSSAVATKLDIDDIDEIIYTHIEDQHEDTLRFIRDCEVWFNRKITVLQSPHKSVENAINAASYINGVAGAPCTNLLKRRVRKLWEAGQADDLCYLWGLDKDEEDRAENIIDSMPKHRHRFPLIEHKVSKEEAHQMLNAAGIKRPAMYELGYHNNNCVGCVKGGMGYWNKIKVDFPGVFDRRAKLERKIGASCINGVYLDELDPSAGRHEPPISAECGIMCEIMRIK